MLLSLLFAVVGGVFVLLFAVVAVAVVVGGGGDGADVDVDVVVFAGVGGAAAVVGAVPVDLAGVGALLLALLFIVDLTRVPP